LISASRLLALLLNGPACELPEQVVIKIILKITKKLI
jgi:uncharacterized membrane protein YraQ (UPF0718 family)